ncbi:hypothetical protein BBOV_I000550 [Babesia bovis T2Bo]|uniref:Uncharacterized protein n=1 Tax=Babesia bovis TaxID=5865 RepID=A7AX76_BABBO|nr:hypothetical protein BBOV_I000550 [Babesia bovis T2Bo]EDO05149.1 hypothetical protein BBOV_I000550 [Babesia bovis T2Bo]|eukprot:XP_001608717.1 hypothetical protein [Babesia bovis T2Bo]
MEEPRQEASEPWLGLCTPFVCLNRRERRSDDDSVRSSSIPMMARNSHENDYLEMLGNVYEGLFSLDRQITLFKSREIFIRGCLTDGEQFIFHIIAKGIKNPEEMVEQIAQDNNIGVDCLNDILSGLKLPADAKVEDSVKVITYHFINKLSAIQHDLEDALRDYDAFHTATVDIYESMRKRFFDLTLGRDKTENGIDFSVSKKDFLYITNSKDESMVDIIFSLLDDGGMEVIDWGSFELNSGRILKDAKEFVKLSQAPVED